jgi:DNA-binding Xre family transcriptional regulator
MSIINRVPQLVEQKFGGEAQVNLSVIAQDTGLAYGTVSKWVKNQVDRADFDTLSIWCKYLDCQVGDILVYAQD